MTRIKAITTLLLASFSLSASAVLFVGCSGKEVDENDPAALFKEAEEDVKNDHYQLAIEKYRTIKNKFPYSSFALSSQLRIADVFFLQESYNEAAVTYETFRDLHPRHEKTAYAMFRIGKSYLKDIPDPIARDLTPAQKALDAYNAFLNRFPQDPEAAEARTDIADIRKVLADKEFYIAEFYRKHDHPDSARGRYQKILDLYPETHAAEESKTRMDKLPPAQPRKTTPDPT